MKSILVSVSVMQDEFEQLTPPTAPCESLNRLEALVEEDLPGFLCGMAQPTAAPQLDP